MARPKGSPNRTAQARQFIAKFEAILRKTDVVKYKNGLEGIFANLIKTAEPATVATVCRTLIQYKLGMPPQPLEHSGEISMTEVIRQARERVLNKHKL